MKKSQFTKTVVLIQLLILSVLNIHAQSISLVFSPNPSPYISDWINETNSIKVIVSNPGKDDIEVKIKAEIYDNNGTLVANTVASKISVLTVGPGINTYGPEDIIQLSAISYNGKLASSTAQTGKLSEGNFKFCVSLIHPQTGAPIGTSGTVCKMFSIVSYQAPTLLTPVDKETIPETGISAMAFSWGPVSPAPKTIVNYRLQVWEVFPGMDKITTLKTSQPLFVKDLKGVLRTPWPIDISKPEQGEEYLWTITPLDEDERKLVEENNGSAQPFSFSIAGSNEVKRYDIDLITPKEGEKITEIKNLRFTWGQPVAAKSGIKYTLKIVEIEGKQNPAEAINKNKIWFEKTNLDQTNFEYSLNTNKYDRGKAFAWQITAFQAGRPVGTSNVRSFLISFCGALIITPVVECAVSGNGMYNFTLSCENPTDPAYDPNCVMVVTSLAMQQSNIPINITSSLPLSVQPGQTATITGQIGPTTQNGNFVATVTGPNFSGTYSPGFTLPPPPAMPGAITGSSSVCSGQVGVVYSIAPVNDATSYNWNVPAGTTINSGQGTTSISVSFGTSPGNICVSAINYCGQSIPNCKTVTFNPAPSIPGYLNSSVLNVCSGQAGVVYSISPVTGATSYNWTVPTGSIITAGAGTTSITVTLGSVPGNVCVSAVNSCGVSSPRCRMATMITAPSTPGNILGPATPCLGQTGVGFSIMSVNGATTYNWSVPSGVIITSGQGTTSITTTLNNCWLCSSTKTICVSAGNSCGTSNQSCTTFTLNYLQQAGAITGASAPCQGTSQVYSAPNVVGVTYTWAFPAGWSITAGNTTSQVTVTVGPGSGNITVGRTNACGTGTTLIKAVTSVTMPLQPGLITGSAMPCQGSSQNYNVVNVSGISYSWNFPAGWTNPGTSTNSSTVTVGTGSGNITVTPSNACGNGPIQSFSVIPELVPSQPSSISGNPTPCFGTSQTYSVLNVNGVSYTWTIPAGWATNGSTSNSITVTVGSGPGNMTVTPSNTCGNGPIQSFSVIPELVPSQPSLVSGNPTPCAGTSQTYSVLNVSGVTYAWTVPVGWVTNGSTTNSILLTTGPGSGNITVIPSNTCGNGPAQIFAVTPSPLPTQPIAISGSNNPCQGSTQVYSVPNVTGLTYIWTIPSGWTSPGSTSNSITVTVGSLSGNITVTPANECGNGPTQTLIVIPKNVPAQPSAITGNISPCVGSSQVYNVTNINGVTYTWAIPTGWTTPGSTSNSLILTTSSGSGNITVTPSNICGFGPSQTLAVNGTVIPSAPTAISGPITVCTGQSGVIYSIPAVSGATYYGWSGPVGSTINIGPGPNELTVNFGSAAGTGTMYVSASNSCGTSAAISMTVTITAPPAALGTITGPASVCSGQTGVVYSIPAVNGATSYNWTVPPGATITSGSGSSSITVTFGSSPGNICVSVSNSCSSTPVICKAITLSSIPATPGSVIGPVSVCVGQAGVVYSVPAVSGATGYTWNVPAGATINSGQGTSSVNLTFTPPAGTIIICASANNGCGTSSTSCKTITKASPAFTVGPIVGPGSVCLGQVGVVYSVPPVSGATSYMWTVPSGATITAGAGTPSITVTFGSISGSFNICLSVLNNCAASISACLPVIIQPAMMPPVAMSPSSISMTSFTARWNFGSGSLSSRLDVSTDPNFLTFLPGYHDFPIGFNGYTQEIIGLYCNSTYYYRVRSIRSCGVTQNSNTMSVTTTQPATTVPHGTWIKNLPNSYYFGVAPHGNQTNMSIFGCPGQIIPITMEIWGGHGGAYETTIINATIPSSGFIKYYVKVGSSASGEISEIRLDNSSGTIILSAASGGSSVNGKAIFTW